jgi:hypothetical protein
MEAGRSDFDTVVRTRSRRRRRKSERNMSDHPNALVRVFVYHLHKDDQILAEHAFCIDVQHRTQTCNTVRASDTCKAKSFHTTAILTICSSSQAHVHVGSHMSDTEARQLQESSFSRSYLCFVLGFHLACCKPSLTCAVRP